MKEGVDNPDFNEKQDLALERIKQRLVKQGISYFANENIAKCIEPGELKELEKEVANDIMNYLKVLLLT